MFAADSGAVNLLHCLTRGDVVFYANGEQLQYTRWGQPDRVEDPFLVDNGDQDNMRSVRVRSRTKVRGSKSSVRVYDGAVALMLALMSCFSILPTTPLSHRIEVRKIGEIRSKFR